MFLSNPSIVLAILATSSFLKVSVSQEIEYYGGYPATTDVQGIAEKDKIQAEFQTLLGGKEDGGDPLDLCGNVGRGKDFYLKGEGSFLRDLPTYDSTNSLIRNMYEEYYEPGYATTFVTNALKGEKYKDWDFGDFDMTSPCVGQQEGAKKGTAYLGGFLELNQLMEKASKEIEDGCINQSKGDAICSDATNSWNEAAAWFVGSLEGPRGFGFSPDFGGGYQLFALGDKRCSNYNNCGPKGDLGGGNIAKTNIHIIALFQKGAGLVFSGDLDGLQKCIKEINNQILVTFIQGTLRYAHKLGERGSTLAKELGEGVTFAAAALPQLWAINTKAASEVKKMFKIGAGSKASKGKLNFKKVRMAFMCNYPEMGISCSEVGTLYDTADPPVQACEPNIPYKTKCSSNNDKKEFKKLCEDYTKGKYKNKLVFTRDRPLFESF
mmetsp:Transcript_6314/g.7260  ORF Transcript_6314/g.7260 Transcript_6314/m.7260 type:complete len:436 (+) Transcript_6314:593-1900(+)